MRVFRAPLSGLRRRGMHDEVLLELPALWEAGACLLCFRERCVLCNGPWSMPDARNANCSTVTQIMMSAFLKPLCFGREAGGRCGASCFEFLRPVSAARFASSEAAIGREHIAQMELVAFGK
jgi:hypothetical protein